ncbi:MAG TPA: hypothetical protein VME24_06780 [Alphaproteobacteria bacterium]|nr:hypothetical protein [Alphaproteobacteria bacterium]
MNLKNFEAPVLIFIVCLAAVRLSACGPDFPNNLLNGGDAAVLAAPVAQFESEMERMHLATNSFQAFITTNSYAHDSADTELADLLAALQQSGTPPSAAWNIIKAHQLERAKLQAYEENMESGDRDVWYGTNYVHVWIQVPPPTQAPPVPVPPMPAPPVDTTNMPSPPDVPTPPAPTDVPTPPATPPPPPFPDVQVTLGLPDEFADYFAGAIAWENPAMSNSDLACLSWQKVLALPPAQRHFKSTWASFMLGKYWLDKDPQKAIGYFQQTRQLAAQGFADSCGLASASFGLEALADLNEKNFEAAMLLYLKQLETGDGTAFASLEFTAERALATNDPVMLKQLAANPLSQRVVTAYLISWNPGLSKEGQAARWLDAVEAAGVRDVESAEELALAAYQAGQWDAARRWAERAPASTVAQWLEAKLLLRAGKTHEAGAMLAKVFEAIKSNDDTNSLKDYLTVKCEDSQNFIDMSNQVLGELGVVHLSQRDYVESLDAMMRSGFWMDAGYVAERILTVDELKTYVDQNWPEVLSTNQQAMASNDETNQPEYSCGWWNQDGPASPDETDPATSIRYLLARRLARFNRNDEARAYFPQAWRQQFDALVNDLKSGHDNSVPAADRARALFAAATITRTNGMELLGTELEPDWLIWEGDYNMGDVIRTNDNTKLLTASPDELRRYAQHGVTPEDRFHYRFLAADLAVEAAKLMPDNSNETARVLCTAGSWIKHLDPQRADPIYKMLVRRCRKTQIGRQADDMHWFPVLDNSGKPIAYTDPAKENWPVYRDTLGGTSNSDVTYYIGTIHMINRQIGWAQSVASLLISNNWNFEQNAILRTTNGGASWKAILSASPKHRLELFAHNKHTAWVTADYDESSNVLVCQTTDGGESWGGTVLTGPPSAIEDCELSFPGANLGLIMLIPDHGMNSMPGYLYTCNEYGDFWWPINSTQSDGTNWIDWYGMTEPHPPLACGGRIAFQDATNGWLLGQTNTTTRPFLFFTHDGAADWQEQKLTMPPSLHDGLVEPWALPRFFGTNGIVETRFVPNDNESTNFYKIIYDTHDSGHTWQPTTPVKFDGVSSFSSPQTGWIWSGEPHDSNSQAPVKGILYRTDDGGQTWNPISNGLESFLTHGENIVQLDFVDHEYGWAVTQDWRNKTQLLKTTDGGETWNALTP